MRELFSVDNESLQGSPILLLIASLPYNFLLKQDTIDIRNLLEHMYDGLYKRIRLTRDDYIEAITKPYTLANETVEDFTKRMDEKKAPKVKEEEVVINKGKLKELEKRKREEEYNAYLAKKEAKEAEQAEQIPKLLALFDKYKSINADLQTERTTYILNRLISRITDHLFKIYEDYNDEDETIEGWFDNTRVKQKKLFKTIETNYYAILDEREKIKNEVETFRNIVLTKEQAGIFSTITQTGRVNELNRLTEILGKIQTITQSGAISGKSIKTPNLKEDFDKCYEEFKGTYLVFLTISRSNKDMIACFRNIIKERSADYIQILFQYNKKIMDPLMEGLDKVSYQYGGFEPLKIQTPRVKRNRTRKLLKNTSSR
jgi:hypothetical protein